MGKISDRIWENYWKEYEISSSVYYGHPVVFWSLLIGGILIMAVIFYEIHRANITEGAPYIGLFVFFLYGAIISFVFFYFVTKKEDQTRMSFSEIRESRITLIFSFGFVCMFSYTLFQMIFYRDTIPFLEDDLLYYILIFGDLTTIAGLLLLIYVILKRRNKVEDYNPFDEKKEP